MDQILNIRPLKTHIHAPLLLHSDITSHPLQPLATAQTWLKKHTEHNFLAHETWN
jgi:hypothetical protein